VIRAQSVVKPEQRIIRRHDPLNETWVSTKTQRRPSGEGYVCSAILEFHQELTRRETLPDDKYTRTLKPKALA
jgi:hypothetical protein